jgi:hypothetical protein
MRSKQAGGRCFNGPARRGSNWDSLERRGITGRQRAHCQSWGRQPSISPLDVRNGGTDGGNLWRTPQQPSKQCLKGREQLAGAHSPALGSVAASLVARQEKVRRESTWERTARFGKIMWGGVNLDGFEAKGECRRPSNGCPGAAPVAQPEEEGGRTGDDRWARGQPEAERKQRWGGAACGSSLGGRWRITWICHRVLGCAAAAAGSLYLWYEVELIRPLLRISPACPQGRAGRRLLALRRLCASSPASNWDPLSSLRPELLDLATQMKEPMAAAWVIPSWVVGLGQWCMGHQMMSFMGWQNAAHVMFFCFLFSFFLTCTIG